MDVSELSDEEFARCDNAIFEERVRPQVDVEREAHRFVAIDIETGDYEVDERELEVTRRLLERRPEARGRIWFRRVGSESAHRLRKWSCEVSHALVPPERRALAKQHAPARGSLRRHGAIGDGRK